ncbi:3140_t:CDS:2 [Funneliformis geosporum]|nr:3140_t:CDS:2 [Funneliformis geosporum]
MFHLKNKVAINVEDNEESLQKNLRNMKSDDEIIWGDDDLDRNQEDLIQNLITQMQNYVPPAHKSTYTGNSARTKRRHHAQVKRDAEKNG